jgi:WD40 repeat protein
MPQHSSTAGGPGAGGRAALRLEAHEGRAYGACWLRDGRILSWGGDWVLRLWDPGSGTLIRTFDDPGRRMKGSGGVRGALQLPDDRIVSWGDEGVLAVWSLDTEQPVLRLTGHTQAVSGVLVVDATRLVSWSGDGGTRLWDLENPGAQRRLPFGGADDDMHRATPPFVLDGSRALVGWSYEELHYVPLGDGTPTVVRASGNPDDDDDDDAPDDDILHALRLGNGNLVTFSQRGSAREWTLPTLECVTDYETLPARPMGSCLWTDGRFAAWYAGRLLVFEPGTPKPTITLDSDDPVAGGVSLPDGGMAYRTLQRILVAWNGDALWSADHPSWREPIMLASTSDGRVLAWSSRDSELLVADATGSEVLSTDGGAVWGVAAHPGWENGQQWILGWTETGEVYCWDIDRSQQHRSTQRTARPVAGIRAAPGGDLVVWHDDGSIAIHRASDGSMVRHIGDAAEQQPGPLLDATVTPCRRLIAAMDTGIHVWTLDDGRLTGSIRGEGYGATVLIDGRVAVSWTRFHEQSGFLLWDCNVVQPIAELPADDGAPLGAMALDGGELVTWSESTSLRRWTAAGELIDTIPCHRDPIRNAIAMRTGVVTWASEAEACFWSPGTASRRRSVRKVAGAPADAEIAGASASGDDVLFWLTDKSLVGWNIVSDETWFEPATVRGGISAVRPLSTGRWIVVDDHGDVTRWSKQGSARQHALPRGNHRLVAISNDRVLALAYRRRVVLLALDSLEIVDQTDLPSRVLVIEDAGDARFAAGLADGTVRIVSAASPGRDR